MGVKHYIRYWPLIQLFLKVDLSFPKNIHICGKYLGSLMGQVYYQHSFIVHSSYRGKKKQR